MVVSGSDDAVALDDVSLVVADDDEVKEVGLPVNMVPTTMYWLAALSHVAQLSGSDGSTLNLPTPLLQQLALWSQQYDVSVFVTFEQDIKSVPPVSAPSSRQYGREDH